MQNAASAILEVLVNPTGFLEMGMSLVSMRDAWKQHHHALEAGERLHWESIKVSSSQHDESLQRGEEHHEEALSTSKQQHHQALQVTRVMHDEALSCLDVNRLNRCDLGRSQLHHDEQMKHSYMETRRAANS